MPRTVGAIDTADEMIGPWLDPHKVRGYRLLVLGAAAHPGVKQQCVVHSEASLQGRHLWEMRTARI